MDIAEIRNRKRANTRTISILLEPDLRLEWDRIDREIRDRNRAGQATGELVDEIERLETKIDDATAEFTFRALGRWRWMQLMESYPPTDEDRENGFGYNLDGIAVPLIAESCIDPKMTESDVEAILDSNEWGQSEIEALLVAAISLNKEVRDLPKDKRRSAPPRSSGRSSTTADRSDSDSPSSSPGTSSIRNGRSPGNGSSSFPAEDAEQLRMSGSRSSSRTSTASS